MLPDRSVLIGQKLVENAKIEKFKCDILADFSNTVIWLDGFEKRTKKQLTKVLIATTGFNHIFVMLVFDELAN